MEAKRAKPPGIKLLGWVILLFALYVLSIGPAGRLVMAGILSERAYMILYAPLAFASQNSKSCEDALTWYDSFWWPH